MLQDLSSDHDSSKKNRLKYFIQTFFVKTKTKILEQKNTEVTNGKCLTLN